MSGEKLCRAFNFTLSPKEDISDECVHKFVKWLQKTAKFVYAVCEHGASGKRHLHAAVWYTDNKSKKSLQEYTWRQVVQPYHPSSVGKFAINIHSSPGRKWIDEYLKKEEDVEIVLSILPTNLSDLDEYFPDEELQASLVASAKKDEKVWDTFYHYHEIKYKEWLTEKTWVSSHQTAMEYFHMRMFVWKDMRVNADSRKVRQMALALHRYSTSDYKCTAKELREITEENTTHDYSHP